MSDGRESHPCIVALCKCGCERIVYVNAGDPLSAAEEREIGKMATQGYTVKRITVGEARAADWFCETTKREREAKARGEA